MKQNSSTRKQQMILSELSWESLHCDLLIGLRTAIFCGRLAKSATHSQLLVEWQTMIRVGWEEIWRDVADLAGSGSIWSDLRRIGFFGLMWIDLARYGSI